MSTVKNVRVSSRISVLSVQLNDKSDAQNRPGRQGAQRKIKVDVPIVEIDSTELDTRIDHATKVLQYGFWVDPDNIPPTVVTGEASVITGTTATLNGSVKATNHTHTGFEWGTTKALGTATVDAGVEGGNTDAITHDLAGLSTDTVYYYRLFAQDKTFNQTVYGEMKSFRTEAGV